MRNIEVSVTIITYRHEKYIRQALDSVFMQKTNFEFEVIVGEDASPDNTREILLEYKQKYGDKLVLVLHDKNVGPAGNSRSVQEKIRGKYVASLEGDDYWIDEYKLQKQYDILENNLTCSAVCHDIITVTSEGVKKSYSVLRMKKDEIKTMKNWINEGYTAHTCSLFRRNIFPIHDERYIKYRYAERTMGDIFAFTLLYDAGDIYVLKDVMAAHRMAGNEDTSSYSYAQRTKAIEYTNMFIRIIHNLEEYLNHKYDLSPQICDRIARVKTAKILGTTKYKYVEMKKIMKTLSFKERLSVYFKVSKRLLNLIKNKMRKLYAR